MNKYQSMGCECIHSERDHQHLWAETTRYRKNKSLLRSILSSCIEKERRLWLLDFMGRASTDVLSVHQCAGDSLQALFERSVNLLQSFGLRLPGAAASLVSWQVGLLWLRLGLLLHRRVPHEGVTPVHMEANTHTNKQTNKQTHQWVTGGVPSAQKTFF